jgi:hypothetical protein
MTMTLTQPLGAPSLADRSELRDLYLIMFPGGFEERVIQVLEAVGVPGYSEGPNLVGRGPRGRHFDNAVWPGSVGEIFSAVEPAQGETLMHWLRALDNELRETSKGLYGLHVLTWPCQQLL